MSNLDMSVPLPPVPFHILLALVQGASHGYGILLTVREQSGARVRLGTGSLYRHLSRLIDAGLVVETRGESTADPRRGTYYRLTPKGKQVLAEERGRLAGLVRALGGLGSASKRGQA